MGGEFIRRRTMSRKDDKAPGISVAEKRFFVGVYPRAFGIEYNGGRQGLQPFRQAVLTVLFQRRAVGVRCIGGREGTNTEPVVNTACAKVRRFNIE